MDRLVTDKVVRRACQSILLLVLSLSSVLSLASAFVIWWRMTHGLEGWELDAGVNLFRFLSLPYKTALSPLAVVVTAAVPVVFSSACFKASGVPPVLTADLNRTGHTAFWLTIIGMGSAAICLLVLQAYPDSLAYLLPDDPSSKTATQGLVSTIASFHCVYFLQLLGLRPK